MPGQPVVMNFQQTNTSDQTITFLTGATTFNVAQNGTVVYSATTPQVSASEMLRPVSHTHKQRSGAAYPRVARRTPRSPVRSSSRTPAGRG